MSVLNPMKIVTAVRVPVTSGEKTAYFELRRDLRVLAVVGLAVRLALENPASS